MATTLAIKDGTGAAQQLVVQSDGSGNLTPAHVEDATQRSVLLAALAPLATAALQTANTSGIVSAIQAATAATQPVSLASLPLPSGAALDSSLQSIKTALGSPLQSGGAVTVSGVAQDATLQSIKTVLGSPLQAGGSVTITGTPTVTVALGATAANQATTNGSLATISGQLPATLGAKAAAASLPVTLATDGVYVTTTNTTNAALAAIQSSVAGRLLVDTVVQFTAQNRSGTITAGGTAQTLMAANPSRRGYVLQNNSSGPLYLNALGAATSDGLSLTIAAGAYFTTDVQHVGTGAISVLGATTGQAFYSREF